MRRIGARLVESAILALSYVFWYIVIAYAVWWLIALARGQTPGKQIFGLVAVKSDGTRFGWGRMFVREVFKEIYWAFTLWARHRHRPHTPGVERPTPHRGRPGHGQHYRPRLDAAVLAGPGLLVRARILPATIARAVCENPARVEGTGAAAAKRRLPR